jgi:hypothetical protein
MLIFSARRSISSEEQFGVSSSGAGDWCNKKADRWRVVTRPVRVREGSPPLWCLCVSRPAKRGRKLARSSRLLTLTRQKSLGEAVKERDSGIHDPPPRTTLANKICLPSATVARVNLAWNLNGYTCCMGYDSWPKFRSTEMSHKSGKIPATFHYQVLYHQK